MNFSFFVGPPCFQVFFLSVSGSRVLLQSNHGLVASGGGATRTSWRRNGNFQVEIRYIFNEHVYVQWWEVQFLGHLFHHFFLANSCRVGNPQKSFHQAVKVIEPWYWNSAGESPGPPSGLRIITFPSLPFPETWYFYTALCLRAKIS